MINSLGATVMAAYTIGSRITEIFGVPASALAMSTAPVVGQALGAGKPDLARRAVRTSVMLFAFGMLLPYLLIMAEGHIVARAFTRDAGVIAEVGRFFLIVPASNYFFNVMMVLMSAFFGSGHTRPVMVISLLRQWGLRVPMSLAPRLPGRLGKPGHLRRAGGRERHRGGRGVEGVQHGDLGACRRRRARRSAGLRGCNSGDRRTMTQVYRRFFPYRPFKEAVRWLYGRRSS